MKQFKVYMFALESGEAIKDKSGEILTFPSAAEAQAKLKLWFDKGVPKQYSFNIADVRIKRIV